MMFMIAGTLLAIFIGMVIGSARRDREQAQALRGVEDRLSSRYRPTELFVSSWNRSAVGLSPERGLIVLGTAETDIELPLASVVEIEGVRDGAVIRRFRPDAPADHGVAASGKGDVVRINTLDLRITVDDAERPVWIVRFFDWPAGGVSPGNVAFQQGARACETWFRKLAEATAALPPR